MPLKEKNIKIFYRIFPTEQLNFDDVRIDRKNNKIYIRHLQELSKNAMKKEKSFWEFKTDGVFFNSSQDNVYSGVVSDLVENVLNGYTGVIVAYGRTCTGKTFTTSGLHFSEEEFGIIPRIVNELLNLKRNQPRNIKTCIQISYLEFNNNSAVDLLKEFPHFLDYNKSRDATKVKINDKYEALKFLFLAEGRKSYVENNTQYLSNLCSSVVTFHITTKNMDLNEPLKINSRLHIIDLPGNDSVANISTFYKNPKEIGWANMTKSHLEQFVLCLAENIPDHIKVKHRLNTLLYYLGDDFSNGNMLRFIGHIRVSSEDLVLTLSMLRFGNIVQGLKSKRKYIEFEMNEEVQLQYFKKKLDTYEKEQYLNSVILNQDLSTGLNQERLLHINNLVQDYLKDNVNEITVMNVADSKIVFKNMKEICNNYETEIKRLQLENQVLSKSEVSLKQKSSRHSTQSLSGTKVSRRSSKNRSKESIVNGKKVSGSSLSEKRMKTSASDVQASTEISLTQQKRKKSRSTSASAVKKSSHSRRKSSATSIDKRDSKSSINTDNLPIPDIVPEKQELWTAFIGQSCYKDRTEEYKKNERDIRDSYIVYIREVKKLYGCKEDVNKYSNELITAQTFRKFNSKDEFDKDGFLIISYAEKTCKENLTQAQNNLLDQQEKVLINQEQLKVYLENRRSIIKNIEEGFDTFCRENYKIPNTDSEIVENDMKMYTIDVNFEKPVDHEGVKEVTVIPAIPDRVEKLKKLQELMSKEVEKRRLIRYEKRNVWKFK